MSRRIVALLVAVVALAAWTLSGAPQPGGSGVAVAAEADTAPGDPLVVELSSISPGAVPRTGPIRISGTVANVGEETWTTVNLYSFFSATPMTTTAELDTASDLPYDAVVGERIATPAAAATVEEIAPGETMPFSFSVPGDLIPVSEEGVYWFGVQAIGQGSEGRELAGRARTFLPLVGPRTAPLDLAVVVPLRRRITHEADGRLGSLADWTEALSSGGRLRGLIDLGTSAGSEAVTYLLDPALVGAVQQLAAGNPARSLGPTSAGESTPATDGSPSPDSGQDSDEQSESGDSGDPTSSEGTSGDPSTSAVPDDPQTARAQAAATDWLGRLRGALVDHQVLALPYGDLDVAAAAQHSPSTYAGARARSRQVMAALDVPAVSALGSPGGFLTDPGLDLADPADTVLISDAMLRGGAGPESDTDTGDGDDGDEAGAALDADLEGSGALEADTGLATTVVRDGDHRIVVWPAAATTDAGAPGTAAGTSAVTDAGQVDTTLGLRQSALAQAAVRAIAGGDQPTGAPTGIARQPLVVVLPSDWTPASTSGYFSGLSLPWLDLRSVTDVADAADAALSGQAPRVTLSELRYPATQTRAEIPESGFTAAAMLGRAGDRLQALLTNNDQVARTVRDEALTALSYGARSEPGLSLMRTRLAGDWVEDRLSRVRVEAPQQFTMTGTTGDFFATVVNDLPQPVTVGIGASGTDGIEVGRTETVQVPGAGEVRVLLRATAPAGGVHTVTLRLTDANGAAIGESDQLSVRSLQVSNVIWVFLGAAGLLLFGAIAFRLVRRVRAARGATDEPDGPEDAGAGVGSGSTGGSGTTRVGPVGGA